MRTSDICIPPQNVVRCVGARNSCRSAAAQYGGMKGEKQLKIRIRRILFPILFCLAVACIIELPLAQTTIFGDDVILWDTLVPLSHRGSDAGTSL